MTDAADVTPPPRGAAGLRLVEHQDAATVRRLTLRIGAAYAWPSLDWDDGRWARYLQRDDLRHWVADLAGTQVGLASLRLTQAEVEVDTFGLLPEFVGQGLGGAFLASVAQLAWREAPHAQRVWLHTSSQDHPNALRNYQRRGFRLYRIVEPDQFG